MPSADFCLITDRVTPAGASGFHLIRSPQSMGVGEPRHLYTRALLVIYRSLVKQISPDSFQYPLEGYKGMNCPCTPRALCHCVRARNYIIYGGR